MTDPTLALTLELLRRPSLTPEDAGCQEILLDRLQKIGFVGEHMPFGAVSNLWARRGLNGPLLVFAGHTDVVPTGPLDAWQSPPFAPCVHEGRLYGRGAADMKGSLAAMVVACERFYARHPQARGSVAFLITSDEEGQAVDGTVRVVEQLRQRQITPDWCIVGEPSSDQRLGDTIKVGRRGSLNGVLKVLGRQGHVAYPQRADNPIHRALPALTELTQEVWDHGNVDFPATSLQISNLHAGTGANNVIPGAIDAVFNFRFSTEIDADRLRQRTEAILDRHGLRYELQWSLSGLPFLTSAGPLRQAVIDSIVAGLGYTPECSTAGGTSDGRFIATLGTQVVELGPVNHSIHQIDEHVAVADLDALARVYEDILRRLIA